MKMSIDEIVWSLKALLQRKVIVLGSMAMLLVPGCQTANVCDEQGSGRLFCCENCNDIPKGAIPQPLGSYVCAWHSAHAASADQDDRVLYSYQFECGGDQLSAEGKRHLRMQMGDTSGIVRPIIVQSVDDPELSVRRRNSVIDYLVQLGIEQPNDLVRIGDSKAEGLLGQDVPRIANGITSQSNSGGRGSGRSSLGGGGIQ